MTEGFPAFGNSYRALFASMLAVSSSGVAAFILMAVRVEEINCSFKYAYYVGITSFIATALILVISVYVGLWYERFEGTGSHFHGGKDIQQRNINSKKFCVISFALTPFVLGIVCLLLSSYFII